MEAGERTRTRESAANVKDEAVPGETLSPRDPWGPAAGNRPAPPRPSLRGTLSRPPPAPCGLAAHSGEGEAATSAPSSEAPALSRWVLPAKCSPQFRWN